MNIFKAVFPNRILVGDHQGKKIKIKSKAGQASVAERVAGAGAAPAAPAADPGLHWLWPTTDTQTHPAVSQGSLAHSVRAEPKGHTGAKQAARSPEGAIPS